MDLLKTLEVKNGDKYKGNTLTSFRIDYGNLLEKYKTIWNEIEDSKNTELNALPLWPIYDEDKNIRW